MLNIMHRSRATSCTESVQHHARVGVQHNGPNLALKPCNIPCTVSVQHSRTLTRELIPSCTTCKTDVTPTASLRLLPLTYRTTEVTTDRAREIEVS